MKPGSTLPEFTEEEMKEAAEMAVALWPDLFPTEAAIPYTLLLLLHAASDVSLNPGSKWQKDPPHGPTATEPDVPRKPMHKVAGQYVWVWALIICFIPTALIIIFLVEALGVRSIQFCP